MTLWALTCLWSRQNTVCVCVCVFVFYVYGVFRKRTVCPVCLSGASSSSTLVLQWVWSVYIYLSTAGNFFCLVVLLVSRNTVCPVTSHLNVVLLCFRPTNAESDTLLSFHAEKTELDNQDAVQRCWDVFKGQTTYLILAYFGIKPLPG